MTTATRTAACSCGQLAIEVEGEPRGVGVCHCLACLPEGVVSFERDPG